MPLAAPVVHALAFMGRHGKKGFALSLFVGLALPQLAEAFRPLLPVSIFCFVMLTFARADFSGLRRALARPRRVAAAFVWLTVGPPLLVACLIFAIGRDSMSPELLLGIALIGAAPPLMGFPTYAALLGLDNSLGLIVIVLALLLTPFLAPWIASAIAGAAVPIDPTVLGMRLALLLAGAAAGAVLLRRLAGAERLARVRHELDGVNVVLYFIFAVAAMDGVIDHALSAPGRTAFLLAVATALSVVGVALSFLILTPFGKAEALVLSLGSGMRNTGLLVAAMGAACPRETYLFFSLLQFPIYIAPVAVAPLAAMILRAR